MFSKISNFELEILLGTVNNITLSKREGEPEDLYLKPM